MSENIKPCPFCGGNDLNIQHSTEDREGIPSNIICQDCGCAGPWAYIRPEVLESALNKDRIPTRLISLWNDRKYDGNTPLY
jgi:Lar family restriction alleviation protein